MGGYFETVGRQLLANGYLIIPIKPGHKRPALDNWQSSRLGVSDISRYRAYGVGVLCGQGARPLVAIDVDTSNEELANRFVSWCHDNLGATCERVGNAPKVLLVYRAAAEGWGKATSAWFAYDWAKGPDNKYYSGGAVEGPDGRLRDRDPTHRLEVLGNGQQFVAYHTHPDTGQPYEWVDLFGGIEHVGAAELPEVAEDQVAEAVRMFEQMAHEHGMARKPKTKGVGSLSPIEKPDHEPPADDDFFGRVNQAALEQLGAWVPVLFPAAREYQGGYRVASVDLMRDLEEDLSLVPEGIVDFGVADMGDEREGKRTPIDVVLEWAPRMLDDAFEIAGAFEAALWLCDQMDTAKEDLGFGLRRQRERAERLNKKRDALNQAKAKITACVDSIELIDTVAPKVGELANDMALRAELAGLIRQQFKDLTGTLLPVADVRTAMAGGRKVPVLNKTKRQMTEFGNAERMIDRYGKGLMFVPELATWFKWAGNHWARATNGEIEHWAKETVRALADESKTIENDDERVAFFKFCAISQRAIMVRNMVALASSDVQVATPVEELDKHINLLGVGNGAVDLETGKLLAPDPEHRITSIAPVEYDEAATAPLFEQTVLDVFHGDQAMVDFFQRVVGYSILGQPREDVLVIPYGSGSNGKSTVLGAIRHALGDYAKSANADTFLVSGGASGVSAGSAREDVLRLRGARFVYVGEPEEGSELREGLIKSVTGGDPIPARGLYSKATVEVVPSWVTFMPTNHKPIVKGDDYAIWRRLLPIPFTRNFDKDKTVKKDPKRAEKLQAEAAGILRWCVDGALAYQVEGLNPPAKVQAAREDYRQDMDLLAEWLDTCCEVGTDLVASNTDLWNSWEFFARSRGELRFIPSSKSLGRRLQSRGFVAVKDSHGLRGRGFRGLQVRAGLEV